MYLRPFWHAFIGTLSVIYVWLFVRCILNGLRAFISIFSALEHENNVYCRLMFIFSSLF